MSEVGGIVLAIDGPSASGKSSTARAVAEALGYFHLDSGALYRGVTLAALRELARRNEAGGDPLSLDPEVMLRSAEDLGLALHPDGVGFAAYLGGEPADVEIRGERVTSHVSAVSALPVVREWVNARLREMVRAGMNVVVDGRDIGTVVFPDAELKIFLTATPEARARRRLAQRGDPVDPAATDREARLLAARDAADSSRPVAPLHQAPDALPLDTSAMGFAEQVAWIVDQARSIRPKP
ncbi:MAG TPA: (d)CMP kinase [Gemmatimonadales bacterium]|nr:(d)CMP kinase [Gemmatimonadales bacterium]